VCLRKLPSPSGRSHVLCKTVIFCCRTTQACLVSSTGGISDYRLVQQCLKNTGNSLTRADLSLEVGDISAAT
jgi:hypothetical protein